MTTFHFVQRYVPNTLVQLFLTVFLALSPVAQPLLAQIPFIADEQNHNVTYTGTYQDFLVPVNSFIQKISFHLKGGSGGIAETTDHPLNTYSTAGLTAAGDGATVQCTYKVGYGAGEIPPGSVIRFIVGGHGSSSEIAGAIHTQSVGGGGGATAMLIKQPGEYEFTPVLIAAGGGGAARGHEVKESGIGFNAILQESWGDGGRAGDSGSSGNGEGDTGSAGTDGDGGGSGDHPSIIIDAPISCGGGGILSSGTNNECGQGAGKKAGPWGVQGGDGNCAQTTFLKGGYGYASGGAGVMIDNIVSDDYCSGGGGGGWSGGGGGSVWWGGGGGGGSAIAYDKFTHEPNTNAIYAGNAVSTNQHGIATYFCHLPPIEVSCKNFTVDLSSQYQYSLNVDDVLGDNLVGVYHAQIPNTTYNCLSIGQSFQVTVTAFGIAGNSKQCTATVNVTDNSIPVLTCPQNLILSNTTNACGTTVSYHHLITATDNCIESVKTESGLPSGVFFEPGAHLITIKATDRGGNTATCSFSVNVHDVQKPSITCPENMVKENNPGFCGAVASFSATGDDNCTLASLEQTAGLLPNSMFPVGNSEVVFTATDVAGNSQTCSFSVTVRDVEAPVVFCNNFTANLNPQGHWTLFSSHVYNAGTDNCNIVNQQSVSPDFFTCADLGENTVTLTAADASGNTATCTAIVTVKDVIAPEMRCKNTTIYLNTDGQASLAPAQLDNNSSDNCGILLMEISQTTFTCQHLGSNTVLLSGHDSSFNKSECSASVTVIDAIAPQAKCKSVTSHLDASGNFNLSPAQINQNSTDNCSFSMSVVPQNFSCSHVGPNTVMLQVTDAGGNTSTCSALVTIKDITAPNASCKPATLYLNDEGEAILAVSDLNNGSTDACGIASMSLSKTQFNCSDLYGSVHPVTLLVKDIHNNASTCVAQVTVKDQIKPTAVCADATVMLDENGTVTVYPADLAADSYDNCAVWSYSPVAKVYSAAHVGANQLLIQVKDWSGNAQICWSVVTVLPYDGLGGGVDDRIETQEHTTLLLYPNPSFGDITLSFELTTNLPLTLQVFDGLGKTVHEQNVQGVAGKNVLPINLNGMASGIYTLALRSDQLLLQKRVVLTQR